ncbi:formimidoylglutamate deiminase [Sphingomonas sp. 2R-10]|uniref:formimidoylglutamate deiminase n=1 Tax=Sphingomonas sp. 2R-10 TaxID=3045148 RepID=UPI000F79EEEE|nr:formimidoylglutamate deiminase [Sphingomonas sp. 2R-10]MDJ0278062.1 formimidoylglutamate deiminase [Sphingomonas sp. 2R-10]
MALWFERALTSDGWRDRVRMALAGGVIATMTDDVPAQPGDDRQGIAIPGLANVHSHAFQRGMAGLAEMSGDGSDSFWTWREIMYRFVDRLTPEGLRAIAALAYAEMLEGGFTRVGEFHYLHHDRDGTPYGDRAIMAHAIVEAAQETGIGLTLLPVLYSHAGFGAKPPTDGQRRFVNDLDAFARLFDATRAAAAGLPDAMVGIAPHSLRAVTAAQLDGLAAMAPDVPVHIHIAEQQGEVDACIAWSGARPIEWLYDHAAVDGRWCLVHATHASDAELGAMAGSGAVVGLCPITEANLGDGLFPVDRFMALGGRFGVGSDSNVRIDAAEELRLLEYGQRLRLQTRSVLAGGARRSTGAHIRQTAQDGGARALGGASPGLCVGAPADIVTLRADDPAMVARAGDALLDSWIFGGRPLIDGVWRAGVKQVSDGRHNARDRIDAGYKRVMTTMLG